MWIRTENRLYAVALFGSVGIDADGDSLWLAGLAESTPDVCLRIHDSPAEACALFDAITEWLGRDGSNVLHTLDGTPINLPCKVFDIPRWLAQYRTALEPKEPE